MSGQSDIPRWGRGNLGEYATAHAVVKSGNKGKKKPLQYANDKGDYYEDDDADFVVGAQMEVEEEDFEAEEEEEEEEEMEEEEEETEETEEVAQEGDSEMIPVRGTSQPSQPETSDKAATLFRDAPSHEREKEKERIANAMKDVGVGGVA